MSAFERRWISDDVERERHDDVVRGRLRSGPYARDAGPPSDESSAEDGR